MSISMPSYAAPSTSYAAPTLPPSATAAQPTSNGSALGSDAYASSGAASGGAPVHAQSIGGMGTIAGAVGGGLLSWKFLVPMLARTRSLPGLAVAGIIGAGALVGGWLSHKVFSNL